MKLRRAIAAAISSLLILGMLAGCGGSQNKVETAAPTEAATEAGTPAFSYTGDDPYMPAICSWMLETFGGYYDSGDIMIPAPVIMYTDDSDPEMVRVWGNFWTYSYSLDGETLITEAGGENPGLLYLEKSGDSYLVTDFDAVGDGAQYQEDVERICSEAPEEAGDLVAAFLEKDDDTVRTEFIKMYAAQTGLGITAYQDFGWDPVPLN